MYVALVLLLTLSCASDQKHKLGKIIDDKIKAAGVTPGAQALHAWEKKLQEIINNFPRVFVLVTSPPGAGKTYLLEHEILPPQRQKQVVCHRIDCSSDVLVERTLVSILEEKFPDENQFGMLVADEYHMLSPEHKEELVSWASTHIHYIKIVCIGNRFNGAP